MSAGSGDTLTMDVPEDAGPRYWLSRFNPAAKLLAALVLALGLVPSADPVTGLVVLAAAAVLVPFSGVDRHTLLVLGLPFLLMGGSTLLVNLLYGDQGVEGALGAAVRVLAIALPGLLAAVSSDPTDLSDGLVQRLKVPDRTGTLLATAMDARAFGTGPRTRARRSEWGRRDTLLLAAAPALLLCAYGLSYSTGTLVLLWTGTE